MQILKEPNFYESRGGSGVGSPIKEGEFSDLSTPYPQSSNEARNKKSNRLGLPSTNEPTSYRETTASGEKSTPLRTSGKPFMVDAELGLPARSKGIASAKAGNRSPPKEFNTRKENSISATNLRNSSMKEGSDSPYDPTFSSKNKTPDFRKAHTKKDSLEIGKSSKNANLGSPSGKGMTSDPFDKSGSQGMAGMAGALGKDISRSMASKLKNEFSLNRASNKGTTPSSSKLATSGVTGSANRERSSDPANQAAGQKASSGRPQSGTDQRGPTAALPEQSLAQQSQTGYQTGTADFLQTQNIDSKLTKEKLSEKRKSGPIKIVDARGDLSKILGNKKTESSTQNTDLKTPLGSSKNNKADADTGANHQRGVSGEKSSLAGGSTAYKTGYKGRDSLSGEGKGPVAGQASGSQVGSSQANGRDRNFSAYRKNISNLSGDRGSHIKGPESLFGENRDSAKPKNADSSNRQSSAPRRDERKRVGRGNQQHNISDYFRVAHFTTQPVFISTSRYDMQGRHDLAREPHGEISRNRTQGTERQE
jgi:hypothetical protein